MVGGVSGAHAAPAQLALDAVRAEDIPRQEGLTGRFLTIRRLRSENVLASE